MQWLSDGLKEAANKLEAKPSEAKGEDYVDTLDGLPQWQWEELDKERVG